MKIALIIVLLLLPVAFVPIYMYHSKLSGALGRYVDHATRAKLEELQAGCSTLFVVGMVLWGAAVVCAALM